MRKYERNRHTTRAKIEKFFYNFVWMDRDIIIYYMMCVVLSVVRFILIGIED